jgi:hypothetical protein
MPNSPFQAVVLNVDGTTEVVHWTPTSDRPTYRHIQTYVGGLTDVVELARDMDVWVNDDGLNLGLEPNLHATVLASYIASKHPIQPLVGPVVFTGGSDANGDTVPLSDEATDLLVKAVECMRELFA